MIILFQNILFTKEFFSSISCLGHSGACFLLSFLSTGRVSITDLLYFSRCYTICAFESLFRHMMTSKLQDLSSIIFSCISKKSRLRKNQGKREVQKFKYLDNKICFVSEIKSIFYYFWRLFFPWNITKLRKLFLRFKNTTFSHHYLHSNVNAWKKYLQKLPPLNR